MFYKKKYSLIGQSQILDLYKDTLENILTKLASS